MPAEKKSKKKKFASYGFKGKKHTAATKKKMSEANKGKNLGKPGMPGDKNPAKRPEVQAKMRAAAKNRPKRSKESRKKTSETIKRLFAEGAMKSTLPEVPWNKGIKWESRTGSKNHKWKGGVTPANEAARKSTEYKAWRKAVFQRDNFTCVWCGASESGRLNADHIKSFADHPDLRFDVANGRTLCVDCHQKTESYPKRLIKKKAA